MVNQWRKVLQRSKDEKDPLLWHVSDKVENHRDEEANEVTSLGIEFLPFINSFLTAFKALVKARYFKEFFYMRLNFLFLVQFSTYFNGLKLFLEKEINFGIIWIFYFMLEIPLKQSKKTGKVLKSLIFYLKIDQLDLSCSLSKVIKDELVTLHNWFGWWHFKQQRFNYLPFTISSVL